MDEDKEGRSNERSKKKNMEALNSKFQCWAYDPKVTYGDTKDIVDDLEMMLQDAKKTEGCHQAFHQEHGKKSLTRSPARRKHEALKEKPYFCITRQDQSSNVLRVACDW